MTASADCLQFSCLKFLQDVGSRLVFQFVDLAAIDTAIGTFVRRTSRLVYNYLMMMMSCRFEDISSSA